MLSVVEINAALSFRIDSSVHNLFYNSFTIKLAMKMRKLRVCSHMSAKN